MAKGASPAAPDGPVPMVRWEENGHRPDRHPRAVDVLVVHRHPLMREALSDLVRCHPSLALVGAAGDPEAGVDLARRHRPRVVLLDAELEGRSAAATVRRMRQISPPPQVIALGPCQHRDLFLDLLLAGVGGCLELEAGAGEILAAVQACTRGETLLSGPPAGAFVRELRRAGQLAQEIEGFRHLKADLLQVLSHELMTPLTVISGAAATLSRASPGPTQDLLPLMEATRRAGERIKRLTEDLSLLRSLGATELEAALQAWPAFAVLERAVRDVRGAEGRIQLFSAAQEDALVLADLPLAARALNAVIDNALKFSSSAVDLQLRVGRNSVDFLVGDRGPGIPADLRDRIFDPLTQGDGSTTRVHRGLGIGLYLARRIMKLHGGTIELASRPGGGVVFCLRLRRATQAVHPEPPQA